jgi:formylglycine-generating enzyme required for sulfatase activity
MPPGLNLAPDGSVLIEIPAGSFTMGQDGVATPVHQVTLSRYFIGKYEVTNAQYRAFLAATSDPTGPTQHAGHHPDEGTGYSHTPAGGSGVDYSPYSVGDNNPVVGVSWYDCYAYCAWAGLSLPTEAQWECAARGSDARTYPWGNDAPDAGVVYRANYNPTGAWPPDSNDGYQYAAPVGSFGAGAPSPRADGTSPFGALDMSGNVWEWARFFWHTARLLRSRASRAPFSGANPTPAR